MYPAFVSCGAPSSRQRTKVSLKSHRLGQNPDTETGNIICRNSISARRSTAPRAGLWGGSILTIHPNQQKRHLSIRFGICRTHVALLVLSAESWRIFDVIMFIAYPFPTRNDFVHSLHMAHARIQLASRPNGVNPECILPHSCAHLKLRAWDRHLSSCSVSTVA
jgi:hypothetical protein